jgi:membrane protein YqaA with SNARE-associated domain
MVLIGALAGLFVAAFAAATILPFQSELVFVPMQISGVADPWLLVLVASLGNTLGAFINYAIGQQLTRFESRSWFPATPAQMAKAEGWFARWGVWILLVSWAPGGDLMTIVAGVMRTPLWLFTLLVAIAKTSRYIVLALITANVIG